MSEGRKSAGAATLEQYTIAQIPASERHGRPRDLFTIWFSSNIMPLTFVTGALAPVVFKLPFGYSVVAILLGNLVGALFMALHSAQGPRLGVPQMIQSRGQFGMIGAVLVIAIAVFMYVGFFASNIILGGQSINVLVHGVSTDWGIVICAVGSLLITVFGYDMIHAVNRWATLLFGGAMVLAVIIIAARGLPADFFSAGAFTWSGFLGTVATTGILWQIAYAPYVSDYSRYMPADESVRSTFWFSYGATLVVQPSAYEAAARVWWRTLYPAHALSNGQWWVLANQCGTNPSGTLLGESQVISPSGDVLAKARGARDGETPPAELMTVTLSLTSELARAELDSGVLLSLRRPDLKVHNWDREVSEPCH